METSVPHAWFLTFLVALSSAACGNSNNSSEITDGFDRQALLAGVADGVLVPTYREFVSRAEVLRDRTADWTAVADPASAEAETAQAAAQEAWRAAMRTWQRAEMMQVGPAGRRPSILAGQALRDEIYSWTVVFACGVDQELVDNTFDQPDFFTSKLVNVTGLDAIEYLLFYSGDDNNCDQDEARINSEGLWTSALPDVPSRRARYAAAAAADVLANSQALLSTWENGFRDQFVNPETAGSPYDNRQEAINQLFAAIFYLDVRVKDFKLAVPTGLGMGCAETTCPEALESRWAEVSLSNVRENLEGARLLLLGGADAAASIGFDDFLESLNASEAAEALRAEVDEATASLGAMEGDSLRTVMVSNIEDARDLHTEVKDVTDILKSEFITVLNLRAPREGAADND